MSTEMAFEYFYGAEAEQFSFIRLPKLLFTDRHFKGLSLEAKTVYGIMLDRMSLSVKNNWIDEENRVYITFSVSSLAGEIGCSREKAGKILSELDSAKGIGLIERRRRGLGMPDIIYVKNFVKVIEDKDGKTELSTITHMPESIENTQMSENPTTGSRKIRQPEDGIRDNRKPEIPTTGSLKIRQPDEAESDTNNTKVNNTEYNDTDLIGSLSFDRPVRLTLASEEPEMIKMDEMDDDPIIGQIKENIRYDWHMSHDSISDRGSYRNYYEIIKGMVIGEREKVRIGEVTYPYSFVRERFLSLTEEHIFYAQQCVEKDKTKIRNMKSYMTTVLFHAPETIDEYYKQLHTYNTEGDGWNEKKTG